MKKFYFVLTIFLFTILPLVTYGTTSLASKLKGRILLQVESRGEAWYVEPISLKKIYLADGASAYQLLRDKGLGIKNSDLAKIPVGGESKFKNIDTDNDGLPDKLEEALKTDPNNPDSDGDSYLDGNEVLADYNPLGNGKLPIVKNYADKLKGRILLQVESRGEAWYIYPVDGKRYYLADGESAYQIMRNLSLGITNQNLQKIEALEFGTEGVPISALNDFKQSFEMIKKANTTKDEVLWLQYLSNKSKLALGPEWKLIWYANINLVSSERAGDNILATIRNTYENGREDKQRVLFVKENGVWKYGAIETLEYLQNQPEEPAPAATPTPTTENLPDFIVTDIKFFPDPPKINNEQTEMVVTIKNIGTGASSKGVGFHWEFGEMGSFGDQYQLEPLPSGQTVSVVVNPYRFFNSGRDVAGDVIVKIELDAPVGVTESDKSNNTYTQTVNFVE